MKIDSQRASFEAWALEYNSDLTEWPNVLFVKNGSGKYAIIRVQDAWEAWQAALESPEVQALRKDAERYRWLRNESWAGYNEGSRKPRVAQTIVITQDGAGNVTTILAEDALDAAVDAAMEKQK